MTGFLKMFSGTGASLAFLAMGASCLTFFLIPLVMVLAHRVGAVDRGGYRRVFKGAMPLLGGLAVGIPFVMICLLGAFEVLDGIFRLPPSAMRFCVLGIGALGILGLGVIDDLRGLGAREKLLGQFVVAGFVCFSGNVLTRIDIPFWGVVELGSVMGFGLSAIWIVAMTNAFNLIDGLDGLATGIALIASLALICLGLLSQNLFVVIICVGLAGSLASFLFFNFHPAKIFLGDTGSLFLGYALSTVSLMGMHKSQTAVIVLAPVMALGFPIFETLISMIRRYIRGVPMFVGDKHHTHHRLLHKGYSQRRAVLTLYAVSLLLAASAILSRVLPSRALWAWVPMFFYLGTLLWIARLAGYLRFEMVEKVFDRRSHNAVLGAFSRYVTLRFGKLSEGRLSDVMLALCCEEMKLRFLEAWDEKRSVSMGRFYTTAETFQSAITQPVEKMELSSEDGVRMMVMFQFVKEPDELERRDVTACLARIFERLSLDNPVAPANSQVPVSQEPVLVAKTAPAAASGTLRAPFHPEGTYRGAR